MIDNLIIEADKILKTLTNAAISKRPHPDANIDETMPLSVHETKHSLGLMRVNHCGEVCAQALYQGQALTSRDKSKRIAFENAAFEELEHLAWTKQRINELGGQPSILNPLFYFASLSIGVLAGSVGDKWNLGFLEETEHQVGNHLESHLHELPQNDTKSLAIVQQMKIDENKHEEMARNSGAASLPAPIKKLMALSSKIMTKITYFI
ncbi:MAG: 2-polyprenyl-3-methyl-6-methoxy-1,4-benzoquinone monooxygenase [Burkholderiales bacterium]|nr:2-polyprenyl-3-methyl-6-methoxy-1,4-benzoquinone monooxygenase [Burkholderiales bacterium]